MKKIITVAITLLALTSCTSSNDFERGKKNLEQQGYTDIINTGYNVFCCDEKDQFSTGFKCKDKNGNEVKGCFCSTFMKGVTIRFE